MVSPYRRGERKLRADKHSGSLHDRIRERLVAGRTGVSMLELARSDPDQPCTGGRSVFTAAVRRLRREQNRAAVDVPVRFEGPPGEYLQVDWGEVRHCH